MFLRFLERFLFINLEKCNKPPIFAPDLSNQVDMVDVAQSVRVEDCGS